MIDPNHSDEAFWSYSLALYAVDGVGDALIAAQDNLGADVNLVLWCCWLAATRGIAPDTETLRQADARVAALRLQVVQPLREVRRGIKANPAMMARPDMVALRRQVQAAELDAEHIVQRVLQQVAEEGWPAGSGDVDPAAARGALGAALNHYEVLLGRHFDDTLRKRLSSALCTPC